MNKRDFDNKRIDQYCSIQRKVKTRFPDIKICNNSHLIMEKLIQVKSNNPTVVECGVYKGGTLISTKFFADENNINLNLIGVDSFKGFPSENHNEKDLPNYFKKLYIDKKITREHFLKTQKIINKFIECKKMLIKINK